MKKLISTVCLLAILVAGCTNGGGLSQHFLKGQDLLQNFQYSAALEQFKLAVNDNPTDYQGYIQATDILISKGQYQDALDLLLTGEKQVDQKQFIYEHLGRVSLLLNKPDVALGYYDQALAKDSKMRSAAIGKIRTLSVKESVPDLQAFFQQLDNSISDQELLILQALAYVNQPQEGLRVLNEAKTMSNSRLSDLATELIDDYNQLGSKDTQLFSLAKIAYVALSNGWYEEALPMTTTMMSLNEFYDGGFTYRGIIMLKLNRSGDAISFLTKGVTLNPSDSTARIVLAHAYFITNDAAKAKDQLKQITDFTEETVVDMLSLLADNAEFETGKEIIAKFQQSDVRKVMNVELAEIRIYIGLKDFTSAKVLADTLLNSIDQFQANKQTEAYAYIGYVNFKTDKKSLGIEQIKKAESIDASFALSFLYEGEFLIDQSQYEPAKQVLQRAIDLDLQGNIAISAQKLLNQL
jgi:tetratricopeptide (TPR) repeat protein